MCIRDSGRIVANPLPFETTLRLTRCFTVHLSTSSFMRTSTVFFLSRYQPSNQTRLPAPPAVFIVALMLQVVHPLLKAGFATTIALLFNGVPCRPPFDSFQLCFT